jgi:hypothetical protein
VREINARETAQHDGGRTEEHRRMLHTHGHHWRSLQVSYLQEHGLLDERTTFQL